jgi:hypothetical protein
MMEQKRSAALGMMLGALLLGGTTVQANAQATQDTTKAKQDTSAYSGMQRPDTGIPADSSAVKAGMDSTGQAKMHPDSAWTDTSKAAWTDTSTGKKAWKHKNKSKKAADTTSVRADTTSAK